MTDLTSQSDVHLLSGNSMPIMGLGTWQLTVDTADTIAKAIELGYRMIDTSGDYGTQPGVGEGIRQSQIDRRSIFLTTKIEEYDDAYEAAKRNLQEIGLTYADLLLIHRPPAGNPGKNLWRGLIRAKQDGLAKDIGVSNYTIEEIQALIDSTGEVPAVNQIEWSPFGHSQEMLGYCQESNIVIQAYSPLTRAERLDDTALKNIASNYNKSPAQLIVRWNIQLGVVPIVKANHEEHLRENIDVFDFEISESDMRSISALNEQYSALGSHLAYT